MRGRQARYSRVFDAFVPTCLPDPFSTRVPRQRGKGTGGVKGRFTECFAWEMPVLRQGNAHSLLVISLRTKMPRGLLDVGASDE